MILGIDPGAKGAIAAYYKSGEAVFKVWPMPDTEQGIVECIEDAVCGIAKVKAYLELVHAMPITGSIGNFKLGMSYGGLRMALATLHIPFETVTPQKWQRALGCLSGGDKNITKRKAAALFPMIPRVTHAIADALLITEYGRRKERDCELAS